MIETCNYCGKEHGDHEEKCSECPHNNLTPYYLFGMNGIAGYVCDDCKQEMQPRDFFGGIFGSKGIFE